MLFTVDLSVVMRTSAARLKGKKLHLTIQRMALEDTLHDISNIASRLRSDEIEIVTDFYSDRSIKGFSSPTHTAQATSSHVNFRLDN